MPLRGQFLSYDDGIGTKMLTTAFPSDIRSQVGQRLDMRGSKMVKFGNFDHFFRFDPILTIFDQLMTSFCLTCDLISLKNVRLSILVPTSPPIQKIEFTGAILVKPQEFPKIWENLVFC